MHERKTKTWVEILWTLEEKTMFGKNIIPNIFQHELNTVDVKILINLVNCLSQLALDTLVF